MGPWYNQNAWKCKEILKNETENVICDCLLKFFVVPHIYHLALLTSLLSSTACAAVSTVECSPQEENQTERVEKMKGWRRRRKSNIQVMHKQPCVSLIELTPHLIYGTQSWLHSIQIKECVTAFTAVKISQEISNNIFIPNTLKCGHGLFIGFYSSTSVCPWWQTRRKKWNMSNNGLRLPKDNIWDKLLCRWKKLFLKKHY